MLSLLIKIKIRHTINYIRAKFDKMTLLYLVLIGVFVLFLIGRTSADFGFKLHELSQHDFLLTWLPLALQGMLFFYLFAESTAYLTLRPSTNKTLLGTLPIPLKTITNYFLANHSVKTGGVILLAAVPFFFARLHFIERILFFFATLNVLVVLQLIAYTQAYRLRRFLYKKSPALLRWLMIESAILIVLYMLPKNFAIVQTHFGFVWPAIATVLSGLAAILLYSRITVFYSTALLESSPSILIRRNRTELFARPNPQNSNVMIHLILHDLYFLRKKRKSLFILLAFGAFLGVMVSIYNENASNAFAGAIFIQCLFSFFLINAMMELFKRDIEVFSMIRALPLSILKWWLARWVFAAICLITPFVAPNLIILLKYPFEVTHVELVALSLIMIPTLFALIYCNTGFSTFPHVNFGANMMNITLALMILFWFYMPFGSIIVLGIVLLWVRKSQKNIKYLEFE